MTTTTTPPAAAPPRPLPEQFARTYPDMPCCFTSDEAAGFGRANQRGRYARWHYERLAAEREAARDNEQIAASATSIASGSPRRSTAGPL